MKGNLEPLDQKFVLHWGEMGTRWGINRTVAQIHALLMIADQPLRADEIAATLGVARSNVSTSLRELQNWGIVRLIHLPGDRRDHFASMDDVFEMFRVIARERKKREVDPTVRVLREFIERSSGKKAGERATRERLQELLEFFELGTAVYEQFEKLPTSTLLKLAKMGDKAVRLLGLSGKERE
ncbi:MAG: GbsR/MarR family transcriptional regulator [Chthoniobacterales bacterium]